MAMKPMVPITMTALNTPIAIRTRAVVGNSSRSMPAATPGHSLSTRSVRAQYSEQCAMSNDRRASGAQPVRLAPRVAWRLLGWRARLLSGEDDADRAAGAHAVAGG